MQPVVDVAEHQLDALAGSETLRVEVITRGQHRSSDRSLTRGAARLLSALQQPPAAPEQQLALPLLILLAQQRRLITLQPQVRAWVEVLPAQTSGAAGPRRPGLLPPLDARAAAFSREN